MQSLLVKNVSVFAIVAALELSGCSSKSTTVVVTPPDVLFNLKGWSVNGKSFLPTDVPQFKKGDQYTFSFDFTKSGSGKDAGVGLIQITRDRVIINSATFRLTKPLKSPLKIPIKIMIPFGGPNGRVTISVHDSEKRALAKVDGEITD